MSYKGTLPAEATGLRLYRHGREDLIRCEAVYFDQGRDGVDTVLRRAALAGRVEVGGHIENHFADVLVDRNGSWAETIALDAASYSALKNLWMRCKVDQPRARGGQHG
jgi:hypothetical protein